MENSKKYYKLNYSQHMLFFSQKFSILKQVNTVCTSYLLKMDFDEEILKLVELKNECDSFPPSLIQPLRQSDL